MDINRRLHDFGGNMPTWNFARYRLKAAQCACEFLQLYPTYHHSIEALRRWITEQGTNRYWACVKKHQRDLSDLISALPARKRATLKRLRRLHSNSHDPSPDVLVGMFILSGWQIFRKAVLQYERIACAGDRAPDKLSASHKTTALLIGREPMHHPWTHWPPQWGPSPFPCDQRRATEPLPDHIPEIDDFKPST